MRSFNLLVAGLLLCASGQAVATEKVTQPAGPATSSWSHVGGDAGGSRYSPLTQIDRKNVWRLERAWTWRHGEFNRFPERRPFSGFHATPILLPDAAGGGLVVCTPMNRIVALDPATGKERWSFDPQIQVSKAPQRLKCLGVTYWQDTAAKAGSICQYRILAGTNDRRLLAVDATTGKPCPDFGTNGQVDVNPLFASTKPAPTDPWGVQFSAPPVVVNGVLVIGHINNMKNQFASAPSGALRAFDARTGAFRWSFDPVPRSPDAAQAAGWTAESMGKTGEIGRAHV